MSINATDSTTTTDGTQSTSSTSNGADPSSALNETDFLQLLTAQLKYQDPMSPTDTNSFLQEQAQFSTVEGITNLETSITSLLASSQMTQAVSMIGKEVAYGASDGSTQTGVVSAVDNSGGSLSLNVGGVDVDASDILSVGPAPTDPTAGTSSTDPTTGEGAGA